jgi:hypothetical protein
MLIPSFLPMKNILLIVKFSGLSDKVRTYSSSADPFNGKCKPVAKYSGLGSTSNFSAMVKAEKGKSGIYAIVNKVNGKVYVGSSIN